MIRFLRYPAIVLATLTTPAFAAEQDAIDGCIDALRAEIGPMGGEVLASSFSEAATEVYLEAANETIWRCLGYSDGTVGELTQISEADLPDLSDPFAPIVVQFEPGTSGARYDATLEAGGAVQYLLGAGEGQTMTVTIDPMGADMYYQVIGPDDARLAAGTDATQPFSGTLPASGDYTVELINQMSAPADYVISFEID